MDRLSTGSGFGPAPETASGDGVIVHVVDGTDAGRKLKEVLRKRLGMSRRMLIRLKSTEGGIRVNGADVRADERVFPGDVIELRIAEEWSETITPQPMELDIVHEDDYLMVVNKPPGVVVHPTKGRYDNTLANGVMHHWLQKGERHRFRAVNRLDENTSGLVIVAKYPFAHQQLAVQMEKGLVTKRYCAFVYGCPPEPEGEIDVPIGRDPGSRRLRAVRPDGAPSRTRYAVERKYGSAASRLAVWLDTGRTHQIRVHLQYLGCPVIGDPDYAGDAPERFPAVPGNVMARQALHASFLAFRHPVTGTPVELEAPLPADLRRLEERLSILEQGVSSE